MLASISSYLLQEGSCVIAAT